MSLFINAKEDIVAEAVDGLIACSGGRLARLDGYPHIRAVIRTDWDRSKVALVSGGGSGHEPSHAGFLGPGMLTAAICGDVFASPSVDAVLAGILAVTGPAARLGVTPGQVILRWQVQLGSVPVPKSATPERQRANLDLFGFELTDAEVAAISALARVDGRLFGGDPDTHEEM